MSKENLLLDKSFPFAGRIVKLNTYLIKTHIEEKEYIGGIVS